MDRLHNAKLKGFSQALRSGMTKEEKHLWYDFLKGLPVVFYRQKPLGPYIVDFYCASKRLIIELDGSQHYEDAGEASDKERDAYFQELGMEVLRYSNLELKRNFKGICADILQHVGLE